jgi:hypothetical protein
VFASWGDNITPPQQALNWILDTYSDESEIEIRGQRIVYMVHEKVGHLGIFVSSKIAKKEHTEVASTLKTIEALAPGLYEMKIDDYRGRRSGPNVHGQFPGPKARRYPQAGRRARRRTPVCRRGALSEAFRRMPTSCSCAPGCAAWPPTPGRGRPR